MAQRNKAAMQTRSGFFRRIDPLTSLLLVFPLFLIYELGVLLIPSAYNGADVITREIVHLLHGRVPLYVGLNAGLAVIFLVVVLVLRRRHSFDPKMIWPVLIESTLYALSMGTFICFVMVDLMHIDPRLSLAPLDAGGAPPQSLVASLIVSIGAGVHEELIFRVVILGGLAVLLERVLGLSRRFALAFAFLASAVLFSAAHHVIGGEPFRIGAFTYRVLCGLFFASLYQWRGVAIAVYTHALYDIYVFVFR